jgi:hypothetical protein
LRTHGRSIPTQRSGGCGASRRSARSTC